MSSLRIILCILLSLTLTHALLTQQQDSLSAYEVLAQYGFPPGILPKGVTGYALNRETGEFAAYLEGSCSFVIETYTLKYKSTITGVITNGKLSKLKGVSVKILLLWLNIVEVVRDGDELQFSVGIASANFGVVNFLESPQCGCGFDCKNFNQIGVSSI
ncbi:hypothetical protein RIF29_22406 [Crotalaria pallida]|uniref:Uncharacterized protein n=1 Tax=Crotalaria pallida TaxID=3830 RepID=A0AAN9F499_CROPI